MATAGQLSPTAADSLAHDKKMRRAHYLLNKAVNDGEIVRPDKCSECGVIPPLNKGGAVQIHGHHHLGYDHPLAVTWLCARCHRLENMKPYKLLPKEPDPMGDILEGEYAFEWREPVSSRRKTGTR